MIPNDSPLPLCDKDNSVLVVIDIQQRLAAAMPEKILNGVIQKTQFLISAAKLLNIPIVVSEQYPKGLGSTLPELSEQISSYSKIVEKTCFSCASSQPFQKVLQSLNKKQIVLAGMEAHICVTQTAIELLQEQYQVYVPIDAVCSRTKKYFKNAINRLQQTGVIATNSESIVFEWLRDAKHEQFKAISKLIK